MPQTAVLNNPRSEAVDVFERRNPADPSDVVFTSPRGTVNDVDAAVAAADAAFVSWSRTSPVVRGRYLLDAAELLRREAELIAIDLTREEGKLLSEARGEVSRTVELLRFYGGLGWHAEGQVFPSIGAGDSIRTAREPLGVVGLLTPWNFPLAIPAWKMCPALIAGCTVVIKPAELTSLSVHHLARVLAEAGIPEGVVNVVTGSGSVVGQAIASHPKVAAVSFTGSNNVGSVVAAACHSRGARVQLEMGGKNALLISPSAPVAYAADLAARGAFGLSGQACTATSRVILLPGVATSFIPALVIAARRYKPGNGLDAESGMGPLVSEKQHQSVLSKIREAQSAGNQLVLGDARGNPGSVTPHIFETVDPEDPIAQDEVFGPVIALLHTDSMDDAISAVNGTKYGLAAGIVTADYAEARTFAREVHAGIIKINEPTTGSAVNVPFGGVSGSSSNTFREQGYSALDFYTWTKTVYETHLR